MKDAPYFQVGYSKDDEVTDRGNILQRINCYKRYVSSNLTIPQVAKEFGIARATVQSYSKKDSYKLGRKQYRLMQQGKEFIDDPRLPQAREIYITSFSTITLQQLKDLTKISIVQLSVMCEYEEWDKKREEFQEKLIAEIRDNKVRDYAIATSERNRKAINKQISEFQGFIDIGKIYVEAHYEDLFQMHKEGDLEGIRQRFQGFDSLVYKRMFDVVMRAQQAQANLLGLYQYVNHNSAVALLVTEGYAVLPATYVQELEERANISLSDKPIESLEIPVIETIPSETKEIDQALTRLLPGTI